MKKKYYMKIHNYKYKLNLYQSETASKSIMSRIIVDFKNSNLFIYYYLICIKYICANRSNEFCIFACMHNIYTKSKHDVVLKTKPYVSLLI